jgi:hypothetical protein
VDEPDDGYFTRGEMIDEPIAADQKLADVLLGELWDYSTSLCKLG